MDTNDADVQYTDASTEYVISCQITLRNRIEEGKKLREIT